MKYVTETVFFTHGVGIGNSHDHWESDIAIGARKLAEQKYAGFTAVEFNSIEVTVFTETEYQDIKDDHIEGDL